VTSWPSNSKTPEVARSRNPKICIKVDFPEPEGPMIETNSPLAIVKERLWSTFVTTSPVTYSFFR
jgi:hypothetical protein